MNVKLIVKARGEGKTEALVNEIVDALTNSKRRCFLYVKHEASIDKYRQRIAEKIGGTSQYFDRLIFCNDIETINKYIRAGDDVYIDNFFSLNFPYNFAPATSHFNLIATLDKELLTI